LDLGVENPFSRIMKKKGFSVTTQMSEDLDKNQLVFSSENQDVVTALKVPNTLLNPYILSEISQTNFSFLFAAIMVLPYQGHWMILKMAIGV
jgi:hypothetical protein